MDPIYGKLATQAINKAADKSAKEVKPLDGGDSPFKQMLDSMSAGPEMMDALGIGKEAGMGSTPATSLSAESFSFDPAQVKVGLEEPKGIDKIVDMLSEVNKGQMQMDNVVNEILYSGKRFSNQELLAIQAHVFHFAQMSELTVKVAEHGVTSVKSVLNTQIS